MATSIKSSKKPVLSSRLDIKEKQNNIQDLLYPFYDEKAFYSANVDSFPNLNLEEYSKFLGFLLLSLTDFKEVVNTKQRNHQSYKYEEKSFDEGDEAEFSKVFEKYSKYSV